MSLNRNAAIMLRMLWVEMVEGNPMLEQRSEIHAVSSCFVCLLVRCSTKRQLKPRGSCQVSKTTKPDVSLCRFKTGEDLRLVSTSASLFMRMTLFSSFQQFLMGNPATSFSVSASVHGIHCIASMTSMTSGGQVIHRLTLNSSSSKVKLPLSP